MAGVGARLGYGLGAGSAGSGALVWALAAVAARKQAEKSAVLFIGCRFLLFSRGRYTPSGNEIAGKSGSLILSSPETEASGEEGLSIAAVELDGKGKRSGK